MSRCRISARETPVRTTAVMLMLMTGIALADDSTDPQRAIDAPVDAQTEDQNDAEQPADDEKSLREAQNLRAVSNCLTSRGLSADTCRHRQPNQDVPINRAQARNLEDRYRAPSVRPDQSSRHPDGRW